MTTEAAAAQYLAEHQSKLQGKKIAVYNPLDKPVDSLPIIYGFNNGGPDGWLHAELMSEDGTHLGSHCCSHEGYMPSDLGILDGTSPDRHEAFKSHYPDGYRMEFVGYAALEGHAGINAAMARYDEKHKAADKA